ncbi:hypothetical protein HR060_13650 [Catenovulum sp. SM1970]|uniref:contractile injection system protein, VgrG/Pvc8 family n=1 Tax=Marinifaba aquimaris TaxID=2741323 RepID=UPI001572D364|nr:contractile injection system protein, VgrG/Pvc8 family [Marinifaba aquimaris]NTS77899.1 hypothetical protein [Marinifaba aquimaris]
MDMSIINHASGSKTDQQVRAISSLVLLGVEYKVSHFSGQSHLNAGFKFLLNVEISSSVSDSALFNGLGHNATLTILASDGLGHDYCGVVTAIEELGSRFETRHYQITLQDRISLLPKQYKSRVWLDSDIQSLLTQVAIEAGYSHNQIIFRLSQDLPQAPYCVQALESNYDFFHRLIQQHKLLFWFEAINQTHVLIITDSQLASPYTTRGELVLKTSDGFASQMSSFELTDTFVGFNQAAHYFKTQATAGQQKKYTKLVGNVPDVFVGASFSLTDDNGLNATADWLCISAVYTLNQGNDERVSNQATYFNCQLTVIERGQFFIPRPIKKLPKPMLFAANVESLSSQAQLNVDGQYQVRAEFDKTAKAKTQASIALSKLTHYACAEQPQATGWHFPLLDNNQVLLGCLDNDADKSFIIGFDNNQTQPSVVNSQTPTLNQLSTSSGHQLTLDDDIDNAHIMLQTLDGEHCFKLQAGTNAQKHCINWLSRLGHISLVAGKTLNLNTDEKTISFKINGQMLHDANNHYRIQTEQIIQFQSGANMRWFAKEIDILSESALTLLANQTATFAAKQTLNWQSERGGISILNPQGASFYQTQQSIELCCNGRGDLVLHNAGAQISLSSSGDVAITASGLLTLKGLFINHDAPVSYDNQSPSRASSPAAPSPSNISRISPLTLDGITEADNTLNTVSLAYQYQDGEPVQQAPYRVVLSDGTELTGHLDSNGQADITEVPTGQYQVYLGEDTREYQPIENTQPNPLYGKISPQAAVQMVENNDTSLLSEAGDLAATAGDWFWGALQGDFNENPSTSQIVVGTVISMIPVVDQIMDVRDICANVMVLTDDEDANDTAGWIAMALTGIGLIPVAGSAIKGVGKVIIKNADNALPAALAVLRKLGKGDPVKYLKNLDWADLTKQATDLVKEKIVALRDGLQACLNSWSVKWVLSDSAKDSLKHNIDKLNQIIPKVEQGIKQGIDYLKNKINTALNKYEGELPQTGITGQTKKVKADELEAPKGNELKGANTSKAITSTRKTPDDFKAEFKHINHRKAATGEYNAHQLMQEKGFTALGKTDGKYTPGQTGIDGIYLHPNPPPDYVITEAKYNKARLGNTKHGKQMSNKWVTDKRLKKAGITSPVERRKILRSLQKDDGKIQKLLIRNKEDGTLVVKALDKNANIIGKALKL